MTTHPFDDATARKPWVMPEMDAACAWCGGSHDPAWPRLLTAGGPFCYDGEGVRRALAVFPNTQLFDPSKNQGRAGDVIRTQAEVDTHVAFWTWTAIFLFVALFVGFFGWHVWNWVKGGA